MNNQVQVQNAAEILLPNNVILTISLALGVAHVIFNFIVRPYFPREQGQFSMDDVIQVMTGEEIREFFTRFDLINLIDYNTIVGLIMTYITFLNHGIELLIINLEQYILL